MITRYLWYLALWLALVFFLVLWLAKPARAHFVPGKHNVIHAIQQTWCGGSNKECWQGNEAIKVARCESGLSTVARNGVYLGIFQLGRDERRKYGHGPDPWTQARAAHYYWIITGRTWRPWACQP